MKTEISRNDYLAVVGLLALAQRVVKQESDIRDALAELTDSDRDGHVADAIWGGPYTADELLKRLGIKVRASAVKC